MRKLHGKHTLCRVAGLPEHRQQPSSGHHASQQLGCVAALCMGTLASVLANQFFIKARMLFYNVPQLSPLGQEQISEGNISLQNWTQAHQAAWISMSSSCGAWHSPGTERGSEGPREVFRAHSHVFPAALL